MRSILHLRSAARMCIVTEVLSLMSFTNASTNMNFFMFSLVGSKKKKAKDKTQNINTLLFSV